MFRVVAAVGDDVGQARDQAAFIRSLPGRDELEIHVTHAYDEPDERDPHGDPLPPEESDAVLAFRDSLADADMPVQTHETYRPVAAGVVELATEVDADLVVVSGRKRSPVGKALFGSTTQSVVLDSPVPVTVVRSE